jgi:hypothetical protein
MSGARDRARDVRPAHLYCPQDLEVWGRQQPALPLLLEKPGRTKTEAPRRWYGQSVRRQVAVEYRDG